MRRRSSFRLHPSALSPAFTLIELLVVIGIIGILIGLLLPTLSRARETAKTVKCAAQLRTLGQAFYTYSNSSKGAMPAWSGVQIAGGDGTGDDSPGLAWTEQLVPSYASTGNAVWNCPSFPTERRINYFINGRYAYGSGKRTSFKLSEIRFSSMFVLSGDCTTPVFYPAPWGRNAMSLDDADKDDATNECLLFSDQPNGISIHKGGNNVLFADGHVMLFPSFDPTRMTFHAKRMSSWTEARDEG